LNLFIMTMLKGFVSIGQLGHNAARNARRVQFRPGFQAPVTAVQQRRAFRSLPCLRASEEQQKMHNKNELDPQRSEGTKTGTDNEVATHHTAYDPDNTSPESEINQAEKESEQGGKVSNPLDVSAANKDVSGARDPQEGGPDRNAEKAPSGRGSPRKGREVHVGGKK
jgi:cytoskeletal protein RodZ